MKKFYFWICICLLLGPLCLGAYSPADKYYYPNTPDLVVYEYCSADAYGAKLSKETIDSISKFNAFSNLQDINIDKIYIIREFKILRTQILESYATVWVKYDYLAILQPNGEIPLDPRISNLPNYVYFILKRENGLWKIIKGAITPSVYKEPVLKYLSSLAEKSPTEERDKLELLSQQLENID